MVRLKHDTPLLRLNTLCVGVSLECKFNHVLLSVSRVNHISSCAATLNLLRQSCQELDNLRKQDSSINHPQKEIC